MRNRTRAWPNIDEIVELHRVPTWLKDHYEGVQSVGSAYDRTAALGTLIRLSSSSLIVTELTMPEHDSIARAYACFEKISHVERQAIAQALRYEVSALLEDLKRLEQAIVEEWGDAYARGRRWLHERDDAASVGLLLQRERGSVREALDRLDDHASTYHSMWSCLPSYASDERLAAIARHQPHAWWGQLARTTSH